MKMTISGDHLRQWLDAAGMSQADLARLLNLDAGQVSRWCTGRARLGDDYRARIVELLTHRGIVLDLPQPTARVFLSTPMAALDSISYEEDRAAARAVHDQLCQIAEPVYWPAGRIGTAALFEAPDLATERNLIALAETEAFVYLQLRELMHPSSCHIELGMAIAARTPVTVFAPSEASLPYVLQRFEAVAGRTGFGGRYRFYAIKGAADAVRLLAIHGAQLLGVAQSHARVLERQP